MYTNAKYVKDLAGQYSMISVGINGIKSAVPIDPANSDYQQIMKLVESGEITIAPADE